MKTLTIAVAKPKSVLSDFKKALKSARKGQLKSSYAIVFDDHKDFVHFVENLHVLSDILTHQPRSVYDLAKKTKTDVSNLNKLILFFQELGAIRVKEEIISGRRVKRPIVDYDRIEVRLAS